MIGGGRGEIGGRKEGRREKRRGGGGNGGRKGRGMMIRERNKYCFFSV